MGPSMSDDWLIEDDETEEESLFAEDDAGDDDALAFADGDEEPWTILVVDDEPAVHDVTELALGDVTFRSRGLRLLRAYSAREALQVLQNTADVALVLLDVVMENDHAGLDCVRSIRTDLLNADVRIILRTGQPGQAPEEKVIVAYDINDYKAKAHLTRQHLFSSVIAALRTYAFIQDLHRIRRDAYTVLDREVVVLSAALEMDPAPVAQIDGGLVAAANTAFARLFCIDVDSIIGRFLPELLPDAGDVTQLHGETVGIGDAVFHVVTREVEHQGSVLSHFLRLTPVRA